MSLTESGRISITMSLLCRLCLLAKRNLLVFLVYAIVIMFGTVDRETAIGVDSTSANSNRLDFRSSKFN